MSVNPSPRSSFAVFCMRFLLSGKLNKIASFGSIFLRLRMTLWPNLSHIVLKLRRVSILKVNYSRKQILKFSLEPKIEQKYFCISALAL